MRNIDGSVHSTFGRVCLNRGGDRLRDGTRRAGSARHRTLAGGKRKVQSTERFL